MPHPNLPRRQSGFTLIEIAIVLVIIGLLLGGILKGQELITQGRIRNVANDFQSMTAAINLYQDRYRALPGDDAGAATRWGIAAPTPTSGTLGDGVISGAFATTTATDESRQFWCGACVSWRSPFCTPTRGRTDGTHALLPVRPPTAMTEEAMDAEAVREANGNEMRPVLDATVGAEAPPAVRLALFVLLTSLIHDINVLRGVLGEPEEVLWAHTWRGGMAQTSLTRFAGDVRAVMNWISLPGLANYEETVRFIGPERRITLTFPSPYLRHAPTALSMERLDGESHVVERHTVSYEEAFRAELHKFHESVRTGRRADPAWTMRSATRSGSRRSRGICARPAAGPARGVLNRRMRCS